ncbi:MAG: ATP-binding protein, partial [Lachnospiraceae bacterium]|nr:ATP-binding protein [Lachnospiraceae bacterium]
VKSGKIEEIKKIIKIILSNLYGEYKDIMKSKLFDDNDREAFASVNEKMDDVTAYTAINRLCIYLAKYYEKDVIVILDEYDTPMQESWLAGTWDGTVDFFRNFFNHTFKTNPYLCRGLITGITRISKESIFSDLNNLKVATTTSNKYAACFGFTEEEVFKALEDMGIGGEKQEVKRWYDGFSFGKYTDIYNPWSIASLIENDCEYDTYWADTSSNGLVNSLVQRGNPDIKQTMEALLQGKSFTAEIDEQIVFNQLDGNANAVWSLLLATGYLKVVELKRVGEFKKKVYTLALTNMEVRSMFADMVKGWFGGSAKPAYNNFIKALLMNDMDAMNEFMNKIALHSFSNFDIAKSKSDDDASERFYHGFVLGLMVELAGRFQIKSNRESGFGRYDVMLIPHDRKRDYAYIIEFKVHKPLKELTLEETVANAHAQIEEKKYETELISEGFLSEQIRKYGFAFQGKTCLIG